MRPMWPITGISAATSARTIGARFAPPSSLTHFAPARMSLAALCTVSSGETWYDIHGKSPTTRQAGLTRQTAAVWCAMSSIVTCSVSSYPSTTMATESPTRMSSRPASWAQRAVGAS